MAINRSRSLCLLMGSPCHSVGRFMALSVLWEQATEPKIITGLAVFPAVLVHLVLGRCEGRDRCRQVPIGLEWAPIRSVLKPLGKRIIEAQIEMYQNGWED